MEVYLLAFPRSGDGDFLAIRTCIVVLLLNVRRIGFELRGPGVADVLIGSVAVAVEFKEAGYGEILPLRIVEVCLVEVGRSLIVVLHEIEFPLAFEREVTIALRLVVLLCGIDALKGEEVRMRSLHPYPVLRRVEPIRHGLALLRGAGQRAGGKQREDELCLHGYWIMFFNGVSPGSAVVAAARATIYSV